MKKFLILIIFAITILLPISASVYREHRAIWMSAFIGDWPGVAITQGNETRVKQNLKNILDALQEQNINVVYFHVRSHCDALYNSAYEPWSEHCSTARGVAPYFDPFEYIMAEAHARGIEVYAWINPYRYCGKYRYGDHELDYEVSHPDWLIMQDNECILNPALEPVQQRICDVVSDILSKYDVDGIIFDDYFYSNPTPLSLDVDLYNAAYAADPSVGSHREWRVKNVNKMVRRVYETIKAAKPYVAFGISPAGTASPPNIADYGLEPGPDGDWQWNAIASDPISWLSEQIVDFVSPQIYWPGKFDRLQDWWYTAARTFGRHLYSSISLTDYTQYGGEEFLREILYARENSSANESGLGFFRLNSYRSNNIRTDEGIVGFGEYLAANAYNTKALTPLRAWNNVYAPANVTNIRREGSTLSWDAVEGMRYTLYAFAAGEQQRPYTENLVQVLYTNTYEIPAEMADKTFGVAVYDRYGNEYSMSTEGANLGEAAPIVLTYPANGEKAADLFDFTWQDLGCDYIVEVADDAEFTNIVAKVSSSEPKMTSFCVPEMVEGKTYYWRVRAHQVNAPASVSEIRSFVASRISVLGPTSASETITPTVTWTPAYEGTTYTVEISRNAAFTSIDYTGQTNGTSLVVENGNLLTGYKYYARVTATRNGRSSVADAVQFSTADVTYDAPKFINPATDGATLHSNQTVSIEDWVGMNSVTIQISETSEFPIKRSYKATLKDGEVSTKELGEVKVASKNLVDGQTYYVRTCGNYYTQDSSTKEKTTEYTVSTFVYSAQAGVSDLVVDNQQPVIDADGNISMAVEGNDIKVYATDGRCVFAAEKTGRSLSIAHLNTGVYIVSVEGPTPATIKWVK